MGMFRKFIAAALGLALCTSVTTASAGGVVPIGYGAADDGRTVQLVPSHSSLVRWTYYGNFDAQMKDEIMRAVASVDYETLEWRLLYGDLPGGVNPNYVQVWFSGKSNPTSPECMDETPGGCVFAETQCLEKVKSGAFDFCSQYRVLVYVNNIFYRAANPQAGQQVEDPYDKAYGLIRHEIGHVLGLRHRYPGPMTNNNDAPFHICQHTMWQLFHVDPNVTTWSYPTLPENCL